MRKRVNVNQIVSCIVGIGILAGLMLCGCDGGGRVPGPLVTVEPVDDVPTFHVDGEAFLMPCFETYHPQYRYFKQFADTGVELFSFNANAASCDYGHSEPTWLEGDVWDYSDFEERIARVLKANPNAMILPRINMGTPLWWLDENPGELQVLDTGSSTYSKFMPTHFKRRTFPCLVSEKWRQDMGYALARFVDRVQKSDYADHIFGYFIVGAHTEEWYHWSAGYDELSGYSKPMQKAFRNWLREKYRTDATLQAAWNRPGVTLKSAEVPSRSERVGDGVQTFRDPQRDMNVIDFYLFYNDIMPETIDYFAKIVKDKTQGRKAIGAFYAYMYEFRGDPEYGHNALARYNKSENLNFVFVTASYGNRVLGVGGDYQRAPAYSVMLHDKLWYHDNDVMSFKAPEVLRRPKPELYSFDPEEVPHLLDVLAWTKTPQETIWMYRRSMGFALCSGFYESYFDLHGGYYDDPQLMEEVARLNKVAERAAKLDRSSNSEILIISDEPSCSYAAFRSPMLTDSLAMTQQNLIKLGAPADHILIDDLALLDASRYKLVVFLNNYNMTDAQRELVDEKLKRDGKFLLFCYAPGYFNGTERSIAGMQELTGMRIVPSDDPQRIAPQIEFTADTEIPYEARQRIAMRIVGPQQKMCRLFHVAGSDGDGGGRLPGSYEVTMAAKKMGDWTSMYSITPNLPPSVYREIARRAGVHIFNEKDDTFYANKSLVCLHANGAGERTIRFPQVCNVVDMMTGNTIAHGTRSFTYDYQNGETLILNWRPTE